MVRGKPSCITERRDVHGYYWRYSHSPGEPEETLDMAIRIATMVAGTEANRSGKTHVVASTPPPSPAVFVLARNHPDLAAIALSVMFEFTPEGECICHKAARH
jgi:hypothetical protein